MKKPNKLELAHNLKTQAARGHHYRNYCLSQQREEDSKMELQQFMRGAEFASYEERF